MEQTSNMATLIDRSSFTTYIGLVNNTTAIQTITCASWGVSTIGLRLAGAGVRQCKVTVNGVDSDTITIPSQNGVRIFTFPSPVFCDGLTSFTFHALDGTIYNYGTNNSSYPDGTWKGSATNDIAFIVTGDIVTPGAGISNSLLFAEGF